MKRRFAACHVQLGDAGKVAKRGDVASVDGEAELVATVRPWGSATWTFEDTSLETQLWQVQICHSGKNAFGYQLLAMTRSALQQEGTGLQASDLKSLEAQEKVKILNGAPAQMGPSDPDKVGLEPWQVVLYAAGENANAALRVVELVLKFKVSKGLLTSLPALSAVFPVDGFDWPDLPAGWARKSTSEVECLKPFGALPPRGRRHVLCQLEKKEAEDSQSAEDKYDFTFFGNIYNFRDVFEAKGVQGGYVPLEDGNGGREYVRLLRVSDTEECRAQIKTVLEDVLRGAPVYFIDATNESDNVLVQWLLQQPSVHLGENAAE
ncbi:unnamed protein product [Effrenium voratum]|uniref:Uncharacterized protein n=1 Tax=Effrenium voratum TaxID=2562239 RepID=A0AA36I7Y9_9DINO|nr:unnamed protein product [Effrenium voratum]